MKVGQAILLTLGLTAACAAFAMKAPDRDPVKVIFDTDMLTDFDDVGALACLHALADAGECEILATVSCNRDPLTVPVIEIINRHYARPDLPVGIVREGGVSIGDNWHKVKWPVVLNEKYGRGLRYPTSAAAPSAVRLYREILAKAADKSVTVCSVGFFTNLADLLATKGDDLSPLSGRELVARKVCRLVSMAARACPGGGREFNVHRDAPSSAKVFAEWPTPITVSPFELGEKVKTGVRAKDLPDDGNPIRDAFATALAQKDHDGRMSWDETTVYEAVRPQEDRFFNRVRGVITVDSASGKNTWRPDDAGNVTVLELKVAPEDLAVAIEDLMCARPKARRM